MVLCGVGGMLDTKSVHIHCLLLALKHYHLLLPQHTHSHHQTVEPSGLISCHLSLSVVFCRGTLLWNPSCLSCPNYAAEETVNTSDAFLCLYFPHLLCWTLCKGWWQRLNIVFIASILICALSQHLHKIGTGVLVKRPLVEFWVMLRKELCPTCEWLEMFDYPKKTLRFMTQRGDQLRDETTQENFGIWSQRQSVPLFWPLGWAL